MNYTDDFNNAYKILGNHEGFSKSDPGVVEDDAGEGLTKYGINSDANPNVDLRSISYLDAKKYTYENYWKPIQKHIPSNASFKYKMQALDASFNQGQGTAIGMLDRANGSIEKLKELRAESYREVISNDPSLAKYSRSWSRRLGKSIYKDGSGYKGISTAGANIDSTSDTHGMSMVGGNVYLGEGEDQGTGIKPAKFILPDGSTVTVPGVSSVLPDVAKKGSIRDILILGDKAYDKEDYSYTEQLKFEKKLDDAVTPYIKMLQKKGESGGKVGLSEMDMSDIAKTLSKQGPSSLPQKYNFSAVTEYAQKYQELVNERGDELKAYRDSNTIDSWQEEGQLLYDNISLYTSGLAATFDHYMKEREGYFGPADQSFNAMKFLEKNKEKLNKFNWSRKSAGEDLFQKVIHAKNAKEATYWVGAGIAKAGVKEDAITGNALIDFVNHSAAEALVLSPLLVTGGFGAGAAAASLGARASVFATAGVRGLVEGASYALGHKITHPTDTSSEVATNMLFGLVPELGIAGLKPAVRSLGKVSKDIRGSRSTSGEAAVDTLVEDTSTLIDEVNTPEFTQEFRKVSDKLSEEGIESLSSEEKMILMKQDIASSREDLIDRTKEYGDSVRARVDRRLDPGATEEEVRKEIYNIEANDRVDIQEDVLSAPVENRKLISEGSEADKRVLSKKKETLHKIQKSKKIRNAYNGTQTRKGPIEPTEREAYVNPLGQVNEDIGAAQRALQELRRQVPDISEEESNLLADIGSKIDNFKLNEDLEGVNLSGNLRKVRGYQPVFKNDFNKAAYALASYGKSTKKSFRDLLKTHTVKVNPPSKVDDLLDVYENVKYVGEEETKLDLLRTLSKYSDDVTDEEVDNLFDVFSSNDIRTSRVNIGDEIANQFESQGFNVQDVRAYGETLRKKLKNKASRLKSEKNEGVSVKGLISSSEAKQFAQPRRLKDFRLPASARKYVKNDLNVNGYKVNFKNKYDTASYLLSKEDLPDNIAKDLQEAVSEHEFEIPTMKKYGRLISNKVTARVDGIDKGFEIDVSSMRTKDDAISKMVPDLLSKANKKRSIDADIDSELNKIERLNKKVEDINQYQEKRGNWPDDFMPIIKGSRMDLTYDEYLTYKDLTPDQIREALGVSNRFRDLPDIEDALDSEFQIRKIDSKYDELVTSKSDLELEETASKWTNVMNKTKTSSLNAVSTSLLSSKSKLARLFSHQMLESPFGNKTDTGAIRVHLARKMIKNNLERDFRLLYRNYAAKLGGLDRFSRNYKFRVRSEFDRKLHDFRNKYAEGVDLTSDENYDLFMPFMKKMDTVYDKERKLKIASKVSGWESLPDEMQKGYTPWRIDKEKFKKLTAADRLSMARAMTDEIMENYDFTPEEADGIARAWVRASYEKSVTDASISGNMGSRSSVNSLIKKLDDVEGITQEQIEAIARKFDNKTKDSSLKARLKRRMTKTFTTEDGSVKSLGDFMSDDVFDLTIQRLDKSVGQSVLSQFGIRSRNDISLYRRLMTLDGATKEEVEAFDQVISEYLSEPMQGATHSEALLLAQASTRLMFLGKVVFAQMAEHSRFINNYGLLNTVKEVPSLARHIRNASRLNRGKFVTDDVLKDLEGMYGDIGLEPINDMLPLGETARMGDDVYMQEATSGITRTVQALGRTQGKVTGFSHLVAGQERMAADMFLRYTARAIKKGEDIDTFMREAGMTDDVINRIRREMSNPDSNAFVFNKKGRLIEYNPSKAEDIEAINLYNQSLYRSSGQTIQKLMIGERGTWIKSNAMRFLLTLRSYVVNSIQKQMGRSLHNRGYGGTLSNVAKSTAFIAPIIYLKKLTETIGMSEEQREKYLENYASVTDLFLNAVAYNPVVSPITTITSSAGRINSRNAVASLVPIAAAANNVVGSVSEVGQILTNVVTKDNEDNEISAHQIISGVNNSIYFNSAANLAESGE